MATNFLLGHAISWGDNQVNCNLAAIRSVRTFDIGADSELTIEKHMPHSKYLNFTLSNNIALALIYFESI